MVFFDPEEICQFLVCFPCGFLTFFTCGPCYVIVIILEAILEVKNSIFYGIPLYHTQDIYVDKYYYSEETQRIRDERKEKEKEREIKAELALFEIV